MRSQAVFYKGLEEWGEGDEKRDLAIEVNWAFFITELLPCFMKIRELGGFCISD